MEDSRSMVVESLIEENRLVNLPRTIKKYTKLMEDALEVLKAKPYNEVVVRLWVPKSVEEAILYKINEKHQGYFARVKISSDYDAIIEIVSINKISNLEKTEKYSKIRKKVIKSSKRFWVKTTNVPKEFVEALDLDLELNENIECIYDIDDVVEQNEIKVAIL